MGTLAYETTNVQNPALGAMLLWRFATGYAEGSNVASPVPLPLIFLVLPVTLRQDIVTFVTKTRKSSGLRAFVDKFNESRTAKNDLVSSIQPRAIQMRELTSRSLALAIAANLLKLDPATARVIRLSATSPKTGIAESVRDLLKASEKFGYWCSQLTLHEVSIILKVGF